jgi:hypothetical protein
MASSRLKSDGWYFLERLVTTIPVVIVCHFAARHPGEAKQAGAEELDGWGRDCGSNKKCML